jgi:ribonuclease P protein component
VTASVPGKSNPSVETRGKKTFPKAERGLRHADFERVYKEGRRHFSASLTVFYLPRRAEKNGGMRIGFTVGRALGGAVERNRMKRRLREAVRLTRPAVGPDADVVINPKKGLMAADFTDVMSEIRRAFDLIEQKTASGSG